MRPVAMTSASKFIARDSGSCTSFGLCVGNQCMSRCSGCKTDVDGNAQSVKFHTTYASNSWNRWKFASTTGFFGGPYTLNGDNNWFLVSKRTPANQYQLTLTTVPSAAGRFKFIKVT